MGKGDSRRARLRLIFEGGVPKSISYISEFISPGGKGAGLLYSHTPPCWPSEGVAPTALGKHFMLGSNPLKGAVSSQAC